MQGVSINILEFKFKGYDVSICLDGAMAEQAELQYYQVNDSCVRVLNLQVIPFPKVGILQLSSH